MRQIPAQGRLAFLVGAVVSTILALSVWLSGPERPEDLPVQRAVVGPSFVRTKQVIGKPDQFGYPADLLLLSKYIVVHDLRPSGREERISVLERSSGRFIGATGKIGEAPGEYRAIASLARDPEEETAFWVHDNIVGRLVRYDIDRWDGTPDRIVTLPAGLMFQVRWLPNGLVGNPFSRSDLLRFYRLDESATKLSAERSAGESLFPSAPMSIQQQLNRTSMALSPARDRIVLAFLHTSQLQFFDVNGNVVGRAHGPVAVQPSYHHFDPGFARADEVVWAYVGVASTHERVFALFSGKDRRSHEHDQFVGQELHVFSWGGVLLEVMTLGDGVYAIDLDPETGALFGFRLEPFPAIAELEVDSAR